MDINWNIVLQSVIATAIGGVIVLSVTRGRALWSKAEAKRKTLPADGKKFTLLVAQLEGDTNKTQTEHIVSELEKQFPQHGDVSVHILPYPEALSLGHGDRAKALEAVEKRGQGWLYAKNGDVLIWGKVAGDKVLRLRFLPNRGEGSGEQSYALNETLELPVDFGSDLGAVLAAQAASAISPVYDRAGEALAALIAPIVAKLKPLAESPPASFPDETRAQLWNAYAAGEYRLGEERGDNARLASAIAFCKRTLTVWTRDKVPLRWAKTQNNLGNSLSTLGARESGTARLEEAVSAYRAALLEWTRELVPLDWATTQNNLGLALSRLGERDSGTARLEEAVAACRAALLERTRERVPLKWAMTHNNLGGALWRLGERRSGTAGLEEAVVAYRAALLEWTRELVPLDWAMTQNNLGGALFTLGKWESGTARLEEAVSAYRSALEERTRERVPLDWATTQNNLGLALSRLGERESGTARLEEAVSAHRSALEERTRERVPLDWAGTQNNLGLALSRLGEREAETDKAKACATLKTAREHFAAALEEFRRAGASYYVEGTQGNVAWLDGVIASLCG